MTKLEELKKKIQDANPNKFRVLQQIQDIGGIDEAHDFNYSLADVLLAIQKNIKEAGEYAINGMGEFRHRGDSRSFLLVISNGEVVSWNLVDDDLNHQSNECKSFLINLLLDNGGKE